MGKINDDESILFDVECYNAQIQSIRDASRSINTWRTYLEQYWTLWYLYFRHFEGFGKSPKNGHHEKSMSPG